MTPGQLVAYLDRLPGIQLIGEESVSGRTARKYRYARTSNTGNSAGQVNTESYIFVDKGKQACHCEQNFSAKQV